MEKLFEIKNDLFDIAARIKSIDENYKIYFNGDTRRFELHHAAKSPTLQSVLPFSSLDKRTVDYTLESAVKNKELILERIERENAALEKVRSDRLFEKIMSDARI